MDVAKRFGENLRRCRKRTGLSQEALGYRASLHRTEIGLLERGERTPKIDTLIKLTQALPADAADLLDGITWEAGKTTVEPGRFSLSSQIPSGHG